MCEYKHLYTVQQEDVTKAVPTLDFTIDGFGTGKVAAFSISDECIAQAVEDGKRHLTATWPTPTDGLNRTDLLARNFFVKQQVANDGYFFFSNWKWTAKDLPNAGDATFGICASVEGVSDEHCWFATVSRTGGNYNAVQEPIYSKIVKEEQTLNYSQIELDEQIIFDKVIINDPRKWKATDAENK